MIARGVVIGSDHSSRRVIVAAVAINTTTSNHFIGSFAPQTLSAALMDTVFLMKGPNIHNLCNHPPALSSTLCLDGRKIRHA